MMKRTIFLFLFLCGCSNVLTETAKTDTTAAIYYQAKLKMNDGDYDSAITLLQSLGPTYLAQRDVALVYASAYSGRCGLNFVSLLDQLQSVGSAPTVFLYVMGIFESGTDSKIGDCVFSESTLNAIGDATARTDDENILMGLSSLTKVGTILNRYADTDNDGAADAAFDHCDLTDFPDEAVREIGTGMANAVLSISQVSSTMTTDATDDLLTMCALPIPGISAFCTTTDKNAYTPTEVSALRAVLGSTDQGIGACPGSAVVCLCP